MFEIGKESSKQRIINGDWKEEIAKLPNNSVDLLLSDPPYNTTSLKWDKAIDWKHFWEEARRVCKVNAVMAMFASGKFVPVLLNSNLSEFRYELIWEKKIGVGFLDANRRPLRAHEQILIFSQTFRGSTYNPQKVKGKPHKIGGKKGDTSKPKHYHGYNKAIPEVITDLYHPRSVLKYSNAINGKSLHPTRKPLELVEWLVRSYSNRGDVVLDPFCGSGTTLEACLLANRNGIGFELTSEYFETAKSQLIKLEETLNGK